MKKMNPVVHFELPAENKDRMVDFYTKVFGWSVQRFGPEMGNYIVVTTTEPDSNGRPKSPGAINGGFFDKSKDNSNPTIVIAVDDIRAAMKSVEESGGKIIGGGYKAGEPDDIPGVGLYIAIQDTEGNRIGMLQPNPNM
jgi:predicted enzyme related to lactoylglutathione lyase